MPKFLLASSIVALTACAALLPVGCASSSTDSGPALGTSRAALTKGGLVISQVFTGDQGTVLNQDFIELFNPTAADVDLAGSSLQVAAGSGDFDTAGTVVLTGTVKAYSYFLVAMKKTTGAAPTITKTAQATKESIDLVAQSGKAIIALQTTALGCGSAGDCDPADFIDLVGWGGANQFEVQAVIGLDAGKGAARKNNGCTDANNNANDFVTQPPAPRAASDAPAAACSGGTRDAGADSGTPIPVTDPDPGDDPGDLDAGGRDAGRPNAVAATGDDGCSVGAVGVANTSLVGVLLAGAAVVLGRRRRRS